MDTGHETGSHPPRQPQLPSLQPPAPFPPPDPDPHPACPVLVGTHGPRAGAPGLQGALAVHSLGMRVPRPGHLPKGTAWMLPGPRHCRCLCGMEGRWMVCDGLRWPAKEREEASVPGCPPPPSLYQHPPLVSTPSPSTLSSPHPTFPLLDI